jgi:hypothetical protein
MPGPFGMDMLDQWRGPRATRAGGSSPGAYALLLAAIEADLQPLTGRAESQLFQLPNFDVSGELQHLVLPGSVSTVTEDDVFWHVGDQRAWEVARPPERFKDPTTRGIDHWEVVVRAMNRNRTPAEILAHYEL